MGYVDEGKYAEDATSLICQHPVILSGVVVREADDNAVEGPRERLQYGTVSGSFCPAHR